MEGKNYFTVNVKSAQIDATGNPKQITEPYIVDAVSCTEAEAIIVRELSISMSNRDYTIEGIVKTKIAEIFEYHNENDFYYRFKVSFQDLDSSKDGKEKKTTVTMLVSANDLSQAFLRLESELSTMLVEVRVLKAEETNIQAVYHYSEQEV